MNNIEKAKKEVVQDFKSKFVKEQNIFECTEDKPIIIPSNDNPPTYPLRIFSMISVSQRKVIPWLESLVETLIKQTEERVREEVKERLYKLEKMAGDVNPNPKSFSDGVRNGYTKGLKFAVEYLKN
tara:strand:+ start:576 stop:953 length:378 start_codon:yes stop_codon:yes gene_type:complete